MELMNTTLLDIDQAYELIDTLGAKTFHDQHHTNGTHIQVKDGAYERLLPCPWCEHNRSRDVKTNLAAAGVGERYWTLTWDDLELVDPLPELRGAATRVRDITRAGHSLILAGPPGTGKTQAAVLLMRAALEADLTTRLVNIGRVAMDIRAGYDGDGPSEAFETRAMQTVDLLVIDDVGAGEAGEAKIEKRLLYFVTEARQNARKPTILTSNLDANGIKAFLGERIVNRLMPVEFVVFAHGRNFRRPSDRTLWVTQ
jgi:DNA replication protein DnaC